MTVIRWAWRHFALTADTFNTLDEAVVASLWASDAGEDSLDSIEVVDGQDRTVYDPEAVGRLTAPFEAKQREEYALQPEPTMIVDVRSPSGDWGSYASFVDEAKAMNQAERFRELLGEDRVRLRPYGRSATP